MKLQVVRLEVGVLSEQFLAGGLLCLGNSLSVLGL